MLPKSLCSLFGLGFSLIYALTAWSHTGANQANSDSDAVWRLEPTVVEASALVSWRSHSWVEAHQPWLIPGALLGGEALPPEPGFSLQAAQLFFRYTSDSSSNRHSRNTVAPNTVAHNTVAPNTVAPNYSVQASIGSHTGGSHDDSLEIEHLWLTLDTQPWLAGSQLEVGKMATQVSESANFHADRSPFTTAPLLGDVVFGQHFRDTGARLSLMKRRYHFGFEVWSGHSWPAASQQESFAVYAGLSPHWRDQQGRHHRVQTQAWHWLGKADQRRDERYIGNSSHSHGVIAFDSSLATVAFTGDTQLSGISSRYMGDAVDASEPTQLSWYVEVEWLAARYDGRLQDESAEVSHYTAKHLGLSLTAGFAWRKHSLDLRYEQVAFNNQFHQAISSGFLANTGLLNDGVEPERLAVAWQWYWHRDLALRVEAGQDRTQINQLQQQPDPQGYGVVGLAWRKSLLH